MPSTDPSHLLTVEDRRQRLQANLRRPIVQVDKTNNYAHNVHEVRMPAHDLAAMSDIELVDVCDRSVTDHFGGAVERTSPTTATVKVWVD
jgi:type II secretory pathway component PulM